jgi:hypothetical protein
MQEVAGVLRRADVQDEQGNGDGDNPVAESHDPGGVTLGYAPLGAGPVNSWHV